MSGSLKDISRCLPPPLRARCRTVSCQKPEESRIGHVQWCLCGSCVPMPTEKESVCCKELNFISATVHDLPCIAAHPSFNAVCINPDVLWAARVSLHDRFSAGLPNRGQITNRSNRYAGYRQFTWWMHGWLGRRVRRVIPSCAVNKIRQVYPEPSGLYTGFQPVDMDHTEVDEAWTDFYDM
uniref:P2X purinoreceptor 7 intracellular domain-containing protein n=1 Tax=Neogobius melanostomus TaxID=47308 RepID=A0A8C6UFW5_9GOBI